MAGKLFENIKVASFAWVGVGPMSVKVLAEYGAKVVKIESRARVDVLRFNEPMKGEGNGPDRGELFTGINNNVYSFGLNLNNPRGPEVARKLVQWADIVVESFTPGTLKRWNLDYENLKKIKPDIIMLSTSAQGQTGPDSQTPGQGYTLAGMSGFNLVTGWPDREPCGLYGPYTDYISPLVQAFYLLAALEYRNKTGKGQYIDSSQNECGIHWLAPLILDYTTNKREATRMGNYSNRAAPHGVYRCQGDDRWCAITVYTDEEWEGFCKTIGNPAWTKETRFSTAMGRINNSADLDKNFEQWTSKHPAEEVMTLMQQNGVPAGVASNGKELLDDPQLKANNYYWRFEHPIMGQSLCQTTGPRLSKTPFEMFRAPMLGEHTQFVCSELLKMPDEDFISLLNDGVLD